MGDMRKSERKVAEIVLNDPAAIINQRIVDLAAQAEVSEPTVVRFCRAIDCDGFQDFKLSLAQQLASNPSFGKIAVTETDSIAESSHKVFDSTVDTLLKVRDSLNPEVIDQAVTALCNARRVEFFGFGASGSVAADAQHRFFRLQMSAAAHTDHHIQNMSAMSMGPGDVVVALSQSGSTNALLHSIDIVKSVGGVVISLAPSNTPVTRKANVPIEIDVNEDIEIYTPMSSRVAHLVVIDVLAIGVAQRKGPELKDHLFRLRQGLQRLRVKE